MNQDLLALLENREKLNCHAEVIRSQNQKCPDDMMLLAKILSRQALLELEIQALGVDIVYSELQAMATDDCPF